MGEKQSGYSDFEKAAMKERAREIKAEARMTKKRAEGEKAVLEAIAAMPGPEKAMAQRVHELVTSTAPELWPRTWYGMPAYARDGKVVCFFQAATKFEARYCTLGFNDAATLDDGTMWPTAYALTRIDEATETAITDLVKRAVSQA